MKKIYIIPVLVLCIIAVVYVFGLGTKEIIIKEGARTTFGGDKISMLLDVVEKFYNFGTISMADGVVSHAFIIKNTGVAPAVIKNVFTSCMCTTAFLATNEEKVGPFGMAGHAQVPEINKAVDPGEEISVEVIFDPAAHGPSGTGKVRRVVYVEQVGINKPIELSFEANVTK